MRSPLIHVAWPLLLSSIVGIAAAQPVPAIDEATFVAELANDPRRTALAARIEAARADIAAAHVRANPSIGYEREEPFVDGTGIPTNYLRFNVPFDISGRRGREIDAANTGVRAATSDVAASEHELVIEALRVFDETAHARQHVELLAAARASLAKAVEVARQRGKAGDAAGYQVQRFEVELAAHDDEVTTANLELQRLRIRLASLVGRGGELDATTKLDLPTVPVLDGLLVKAAARGDLRAAQLRTDAAARRLSAAERGWVPMPSLMFGAMTADQGEQTGTGYVAGLTLTIPVFDRGQADRARAIAERTAATAATRVLEREIPVAVRIAHASLVSRIEQARKLETGQIDRLDGIVRAVETAYREGSASVVELLDAHRAARAARVRALELRHQVARDKRELELAVGHRL
jgi:cobalt-zinc-cadmium efflux system outer membrane protein